jgi:hypothetical protein
MVGLVTVLSALAFAAPFAAAAPRAPKPAAAVPTEEVALKEEAGALLVPVVINDSVKLDFMLDSGASVVTIPADVAMTLIRTGTLTRDDYLGSPDLPARRRPHRALHDTAHSHPQGRRHRG